MSHELEKLLGGFASDTLTAGEKQQLYKVALTDQQLFNALADEQALKELLTDPVVRRRLLQALQATRDERTGGSRSWLDWFRRPSGLAWAGGLAGAVLAVVLGTRIYQESLRQESQLTTKEETAGPTASQPVPTPSQLPPPPTNEPQATSEPKSPSSLPPMKEALTGKTSDHVPPSHTASVERRARQSRHDAPASHAEADTVPNKTESVTNMLHTSTDESSPFAHQPTVSASAPSHPASPSLQDQSEVDSAVPSQERASLSARLLFYGAGPQDQKKSMAQDTRRREKALSESDQPPNRSEFASQPLAMAKSKPASPVRPVGIRYSLTHREPSEQFRDSTTERASELTIESNQEGYLQIWRHVSSSNLQLLFPTAETEPSHAKLSAHTPLTLSIPSTPGMLVFRFARTGAIPSATFDSRLLDEFARGQLRESVMTGETPGFQPPIHYIVNQDPSLSEIVVQIVLPQP